MAEERKINFNVVGEDPLQAPAPQFANFVAVSHAGTEVQFEFIFLDLNEIAQRVAASNQGDKPVEFRGRTVSKVIVPVANFVQLKDHLDVMFTRLQEAQHGITETKQEAATEGRRSAGR